ncbi:hypothetical protein EN829_008565 [Mesorhizobium sp. M00.F.Ca.ET.186.01.1.1]|nr:hypothetical protein EN848_00100 [bacterium M00.F.Ca.ET.205.01.1.1]TGU54278.1 hypothetical protein EN795_04515 [bacterium M00.F.Ca.ET.152.01.1.1]TGV38927.1 hypothetical protein EN829_008565 [Mesorhizobium sp. M00.F.Ca.ET.186.01.1.1]TGZ43852.1 hypothetical protein EN805_04520 [bacterium M00.F.Ca.ET.162.01.1.1]
MINASAATGRKARVGSRHIPVVIEAAGPALLVRRTAALLDTSATILHFAGATAIGFAFVEHIR